jgi:hypothetical protein
MKYEGEPTYRHNFSGKAPKYFMPLSTSNSAATKIPKITISAIKSIWGNGESNEVMGISTIKS